MLDPKDANAWLAFIGIILSAIGWVYRLTVKNFVAKSHRRFNGIGILVDQFPQLLKEVKEIRADQTYNGGASSKDMLRALVYSVDFLLQEAEVAVTWRDSNNKVTKVSGYATELMECAEADLLGFEWKQRIDEGDLPRVEKHWESFVRDQRGGQIKRIKLAGKDFTMDADVVPLFDATGKFMGHLSFSRKSRSYENI